MNLEHTDGDTTILTRDVGDEFETLMFFLDEEGVPQTAIVGRRRTESEAAAFHREICARYRLVDELLDGTST